ncbi:MAG TPA: hypothetical protein VH722_10990 [Alphaproteobacteria bacterium]|jgi:hypothetical protein|nr:hypothetical protein [Alphaproteobacteria bacterium]
MFMSLDTTAGRETAGSFSAAVKTDGREVVVSKWYMRTRLLLALWVVLSLGWGTAVGYDLYQRVTMQADMSRDVESDLDSGFASASCVGKDCGTVSAKAAQTWNWSGIFSTYLKFGSDEMAEWALGPPAALLLLGIGATVMLRRRGRRVS